MASHDEPPLVVNRALAEDLLNQYHLLRTKLAARQSIYHTICSRGGSVARQTETFKLVEEAQAELDQNKLEILGVMGVEI